MILAIPARMGQALHGSRHDSSPFDSSQQTTEGELYAGNAQSSSRLTGEPVAYLLCSVNPFARDVFVLIFGNCKYPVGFSKADSCAVGDSSPCTALFHSPCFGLGLTRGNW